jgi:hypothetical protein
VIWVSHEAEYFCDQIWTGQITLNAFDKSAFTRNAFSTKILVTEADECADPARRANHPPCYAVIATRWLAMTVDSWIEPVGQIG